MSLVEDVLEGLESAQKRYHAVSNKRSHIIHESFFQSHFFHLYEKKYFIELEVPIPHLIGRADFQDTSEQIYQRGRCDMVIFNRESEAPLGIVEYKLGYTWPALLGDLLRSDDILSRLRSRKGAVAISAAAVTREWWDDNSNLESEVAKNNSQLRKRSFLLDEREFFALAIFRER